VIIYIINKIAYSDHEGNNPILCYYCHTRMKIIGIYKLICKNGHIRELERDGSEKIIS